MGPLALGGIAVGSGILGAWGGKQEADAIKEANRQRMEMAVLASNKLKADSIFKTYQRLEQQQQPFINQLMASQALAGQRASQGAQAGLARAGLGSTGLGMALGAGLDAGAAFQGNQLRASILSDLMGQATNLRMGQASALSGVPIQAAPSNTVQGFLGGAGGALQALGPYYSGGGNNQKPAM